MLRKLTVGAVAAAMFAIGMGVSLSVSRHSITVLGTSEAVARSDRFWSAPTVSGMSAETYDTLADLAQSSDLVIVGTVQSVERGREWIAIPEYVDDPLLADQAFARFASVTISIEQIVDPVRAPLPDRSSVKLEAFLGRAETFSILQNNIPKERSIFFLRNKGKEDSIDFFRFVNDNQGLLRDFDGRLRISPTGEDHFLTHLDGKRFEDILAEVIKARGGS